MEVKKAVAKLLRLNHEDPTERSPAVEQTAEMRSLSAEIRDEFERRKEERRPFELQWRLNQNFLLGNQYCDIMDQIGEVVDYPTSFDWEQRSVYNQIAPIIETRESKLSRVHPGLIVSPVTSELDDIIAAKISTRLLKAQYSAMDMAMLQRNATEWAEICGSVFYKNVWDVRSGRIIGYDNGIPIYEGDVRTIVVPAYEIYPSSCYRDGLKNQDSLIHAKVYTVDEIESKWHIRVEGRELNVMTMDTSGMTAGGNGYNPNMTQVMDHMLDDAELVLEYYEKPNAHHPKGRLLTLVGEIVVHIGDLPFHCGEYRRPSYPFVQQFCLHNPGTFFGTSLIERLIPLQRDYNAVKNRMNEHIARIATGNMIVEHGSLTDDSVLDTGLPPGTVLEYEVGRQPPQWMQPGDIPNSLFTKLQEMRQEFIDISGVSEMSRTSSAPNSVSSGVGLEILKEQDDTRLTLTAEYIHDAMKENGKQWLRLFKQFCTLPRVTRVIGDDYGDVVSIVWSANDITSDDVDVDTVNEMTNTPAQRKQMVLDLLNAGLFLDPDTGKITREAQAKIFETFEIGGNWATIVDVDALQVNAARRENLETESGAIPRIEQFDKHSLHVQEHTKYMLGAEYRRLQKAMPEVAQALQRHVEAHKQIAVQQAMALTGGGGMTSGGLTPSMAENPNATQQGIDPNPNQ